jgi:hypothetical protein
MDDVWGYRYGDKIEDERVVWMNVSSQLGGRATRSMYYYPDGSPILDDELLPATLKWGMLLETNRSVGSTRTLYGERLSTVWLGLDHQWGSGQPLIFETMLFAPKTDAQRDREHNWMDRYFTALKRSNETGEPFEIEEDEQTAKFEVWVKKNYPHDQLQLRYATKSEAEDSHDRLKLQCLIPPRWRHFLLWTVGRNCNWKFYDDEDEE